MKALIVKNKGGRPSTFNPEVVTEICRRLSTGECLEWICAEDGMPPVRTVNDWRALHDSVAADFARARSEGFDAMAAETLRIADDGSNDFMMKRGRDGEQEQAYDAEHVQRSKLRIDTRLKLLARWDPKRYGERTTLVGDADNPVAITAIERRIVKPKLPE